MIKHEEVLNSENLVTYMYHMISYHITCTC